MDVHNLKIQTGKCDFLRHEASFLGHVLRTDEIPTQDSKISTSKNWSPLTDIRSVRVFVSLYIYYRKYIWRFAEIATPLTNLLKDWGEFPPNDPDVLVAVDKLKETLIRIPVLDYIDVNDVDHQCGLMETMTPLTLTSDSKIMTCLRRVVGVFPTLCRFWTHQDGTSSQSALPLLSKRS
jgi:hypothetical protein